MNYIFIFLIIISFVCAAINHRLDIAVDEMLAASQKAVEIAFGLIGIMGFWLGIVNIAKKSGLMDVLSRLIQKPLLLRKAGCRKCDSPPLAVGQSAVIQS